MSARLSAIAVTAAIALVAFSAAAPAEVAQKGSLRVKFDGRLTPTRLPRLGTRPVAVSIAGRITTTNGSEPPQLRQIGIAINRHGHIDYNGLPVCRLEQIQPSTTENALAACGASKVG